MRFVGIDIGAEKHFVAIVDETGVAQRKPMPFAAGSGNSAELIPEILAG